MSPDNMRIVAYGLYVLGAVFLLAALFFFWKLKIPAVISDLNGKTARRDIARTREEREMKKEKATNRPSSQPKEFKGYDAQAAETVKNGKKKKSRKNRKSANPGAAAIRDDLSEENTVPLSAGAQGQPAAADLTTTPLSAMPYAAAGEMTAEMDIEDEVTVPLSDPGWDPGYAAAPAHSSDRRRPEFMDTTSDLTTGSELDPANREYQMPEAATALLRFEDDDDSCQTTALSDDGMQPASKMKTIERIILTHTDDVIPVDSY